MSVKEGEPRLILCSGKISAGDPERPTAKARFVDTPLRLSSIRGRDGLRFYAKAGTDWSCPKATRILFNTFARIFCGA